MRSFFRTAAHVCVSYAILTAAGARARADVVQDAADKVSLGQYRVYQVDIQDMGLGLYGGPAYDQGYRSRDGWIYGVARIDPAWNEGGTPGNLEARLYLADQLAAMGLDVWVQGDYRNVVAELRGSERPGDIYIVSGHYDTTSNGERPGGDDNASGTAGVLEAARVLSQYAPKATLRFIGFNAEEDWMLGSQEYVNEVVVARGERVLGVLNLDMILRPGWDSNPQEVQDLDIETGQTEDCITWAHTFMDAVTKYAPSVTLDATSPGFDYPDAGDHGPFIGAGYPALMISENTAADIWWGGSNAYYHKPGDASDGPANDPLSISGITYNYDFATGVVRAAVATLAEQAGIVAKPGPAFVEQQAIPTHGARDIESFTIGGDSYLAVANGGSDVTHDVNVSLYRWDGAAFVESQSIPSHGAADCEFFSLAGEQYLAVANTRDDATLGVDSKLYRWDGSAFTEFQSIPTLGAADCEFFTIGAEGYLAVANSGTDATYDVNSVIYRWDGTAFAAFQSIPTHGAADWESFTVAGESFLAVANMRDDATHAVESRIYRWDGTRFEEFQAVPTQGAVDWESFTLGEAAYLAVANSRNDVTHNVDSRVYRWDGSAFVEHQFVPTHGAADWEFFSVGDDSFLAVANAYDDLTHSLASRLYRWNGTRFIEFRSISTQGANSLESLAPGDDLFLAVANGGDDLADSVASTIWRYDVLP